MRRLTSQVEWLQPRDHAEAARTMSILCAVAAAVTLVLAIADPDSSTATIMIATPLAALVLVAGWLARFIRASHRLIWAGCPFVAIAMVVAMDLITSDGSVAAQVFFFFPALYGASQLRRTAALSVCAVTVAGEIIVVSSHLPARTALIDAVYVTAAIVTTVMLLVHSALRQEELVGQLKQQAAVDPLTGLATRRVLDRAAQSALTGGSSAEGSGLIVLDVDDFKSINDRYGHPGGDEVLIQLAALLTGDCRENDIVSRLGGDEIALLLPGCSLEVLSRRADQLVWNVRAHTFLLTDGTELAISVSAGVAHAPTHALDLRSLYSTADTALYEAKRAGRNRVGVPPPDRVRVSS